LTYIITEVKFFYVKFFGAHFFVIYFILSEDFIWRFWKPQQLINNLIYCWSVVIVSFHYYCHC